MTRQDWEETYRILQDILSDFQSAYHTYKHGKNKKIRGAAEREVKNAIMLADLHITKRFEVYKLLTGEQGSDYSRAIMYDEFKQANYFGRDLYRLLKDIEKKITEFT